MPDLIQSLQGNDLGFLKIIADFWGIELTHPELPSLVNGMLDKSLLDEMIDALPTEARCAFDLVNENQGRLPWQVFTRRFGEVRMMGAARRDRERPDLHPISPAEVLWYRSLVRKAFFKITGEPQEYAYIPDDLFDLMQLSVAPTHSVPGRPASPTESSVKILASDRILDESCTFLASLRSGMPIPTEETGAWLVEPDKLKGLLQTIGLIDGKNKPRTETVKTFLEAPRSQALSWLTSTWLQSKTYNELRQLENLKFEGNWVNDPVQTRQVILDLVSRLPESTWWSLPAFISGIHETHPDFQRPAGDYDSWFIFKESEQKYLRGFSSWDEVDGALIRFLVNGPFHWMGLFDLAAPTPEAGPTAFRRSTWFEDLLKGLPPAYIQPEKLSYQITSNGQFQLSLKSPRSFRYQIARFCLFEKHNKTGYFYRLSHDTLTSATQQGLNPRQLITLIKKFPPTTPIPPGVLQALERWEKLGVQAAIENVMILRVSSEEIISLLKKNPRVQRFLGEQLNPTTIIINPAGNETIHTILMEAGYISKI